MFQRAVLASGVLLVVLASCKADSSGLFQPLDPNAGAAPNTGGSGGVTSTSDPGTNAGSGAGSMLPEGQGGGIGLEGMGGSAGVGVSNERADAGIPDAGDAGIGADATTAVADCASNAEVCDGLDNDCDDAVDEGNACTADCAGFALGGRGYMFCSDSVARDAAAGRCQLEGMRLAWIETPEENDFLVDSIESADVPESDSEEILTYIGGSDAATEGAWIWRGSAEIPDGFQFWQGEAAANGGQAVGDAYENWSPTEPNDTDEDEDCAVMSVLGNNNRVPGNWDDRNCGSALPFVCEVP